MTERSPFVPQSQYDKAALVACGMGELFGPGNAQLPVDNMLMVDRITHISSSGGMADRGELIAELDIHPCGTLPALEAAGVKPASRPLRMRVNQLRWETVDNVLWLEFRLGKGSFATSVLRELVRYTQHRP